MVFSPMPDIVLPGAFTCDCHLDKNTIKNNLKRFVKIDANGLKDSSGFTSLIDFFNTPERYGIGDLDNLPNKMTRLATDDPKLITDAALQFTLWFLRDELVYNFNNSTLYGCVSNYLNSMTLNSTETILQYFERNKENILPHRSAQSNLNNFIADLLSPDASRYSTLKKLIFEDDGISHPHYLYFMTLDQIKTIIEGVEKIINDTIKSCTCEVYKYFGADDDSPCPQIFLITVGEGSGTKGLLNRLNIGIRLFNYDYYSKKVRDNDGSEYNMILPKNINKQVAGVNCVTLNKDRASCHLSTFGADYQKSTIVEISLSGERSKLYLVSIINQKTLSVVESIRIIGSNPVRNIPPFFYSPFESALEDYVGDIETNSISTDPTGNIINIAPATLNPYIWSDITSTGEKTYGNYDSVSGILTINEKFLDRCISLKVLGRHKGGGHENPNTVDEVVIYAIFVPKRFKIQDVTAHLYFNDNIFEPETNLPKTQILNKNETKNLLKALVELNNFSLSTSLFARGIGKESTDMEDNGLNTEARITKSENQIDRPIDNGSNANYSMRRYSYINLALFPSYLEIYIESYVSPLRCTWNDPNPFPGNLIGFNGIIQNVTIGSPKKIYNHALSALRTLGTLEYITDQLCNIAEEMKSAGEISESQKDDLIDKITTALNQSSVDVFDKDGALRGSITYTDYLTKIKP